MATRPWLVQRSIRLLRWWPGRVREKQPMPQLLQHNQDFLNALACAASSTNLTRGNLVLRHTCPVQMDRNERWCSAPHHAHDIQR